MTYRSDPVWWYQSKTEWNKEQWRWRDNLHSLKFQYYWNLTIRLLRVISTTLFGGDLTPLLRSSRCILQPHLTVQHSAEVPSGYLEIPSYFIRDFYMIDSSQGKGIKHFHIFPYVNSRPDYFLHLVMCCNQTKGYWLRNNQK